MSHTRMTTLAELNKDDNSHSSGACFHILVCRCNINFNKDLSVFLFYPENRLCKLSP